MVFKEIDNEFCGIIKPHRPPQQSAGYSLKINMIDAQHVDHIQYVDEWINLSEGNSVYLMVPISTTLLQDEGLKGTISKGTSYGIGANYTLNEEDYKEDPESNNNKLAPTTCSGCEQNTRSIMPKCNYDPGAEYGCCCESYGMTCIKGGRHDKICQGATKTECCVTACGTRPFS